jgi:hypothetical protein
MDVDRILEIAERIKTKRAELKALQVELVAAAGGSQGAPSAPRRGRPGGKADQVLELLREDGGALTPKQISERLPGIRQKYAQIIVVALAKSGKIERVPGPGGQYRAKQ